LPQAGFPKLSNPHQRPPEDLDPISYGRIWMDGRIWVQLLEISLRGDGPNLSGGTLMMELAISSAWGPGLDHIARHWGTTACTKALFKALGLGQDCRDAVIAAAFLCGKFAVVEERSGSAGGPAGLRSFEGIPPCPTGRLVPPQEWLREAS
jgi:hypothetical protein